MRWRSISQHHRPSKNYSKQNAFHGDVADKSRAGGRFAYRTDQPVSVVASDQNYRAGGADLPQESAAVERVHQQVQVQAERIPCSDDAGHDKRGD